MADASTKVVHDSSIAYITNGTSAAALAIVGATVANALSSTNLKGRDSCDLVLSGVSTSNTTSSTAMYINIYRRDLYVGGISAADDTAPGTSNKVKLVGYFARPATASSSNFIMTAIDIPLPGGSSGCEFYIENAMTNSMENTGWALTVIPKAYVGATT